MNKEIDPSTITEKYVEQIRLICEPLFANSQYSYFSHVQYYQNCTGIALATNHKVVRYTWETGQYLRLQDLDDMPDFRLLHRDENERSKKLCDFLNIDHMILCLFRYASHYEVNSFGTQSKLIDTYDFDLNNIDLLSLFSNYFRDKTRDIIDKAKQNPYEIPDFDKGYVSLKKYNYPTGSLESKITAERLILKYNLSSRELECMKLLSQSKSIKEIARETNLSPNTIKLYVKNLKIKINCSKIAEIIKLYYENE